LRQTDEEVSKKHCRAAASFARVRKIPAGSGALDIPGAPQFFDGTRREVMFMRSALHL
jgi:hypothetical protein